MAEHVELANPLATVVLVEFVGAGGMERPIRHQISLEAKSLRSGSQRYCPWLHAHHLFYEISETGRLHILEAYGPFVEFWWH